MTSAESEVDRRKGNIHPRESFLIISKKFKNTLKAVILGQDARPTFLTPSRHYLIKGLSELNSISTI